MTDTMTPPPLVGWRDQLESGRVRLAALVRGLEKEYFDWSPDVGIASIRDHLWAIAESERDLLSALSGRGPVSGNYGAFDIAVPEMMKLLDACGKNLVKRLGEWDEIGPDQAALEALGTHLERRAHHTGAIAVLAQLIDPERRCALRF